MLLQEKADQVLPFLRATGLDCWLLLVRETGLRPDPGFDLVVGTDVVRNSAFLFGAGGERTALAARFDIANVRATGVFAAVLGYDEGIRPQRGAAAGAPARAQVGDGGRAHPPDNRGDAIGSVSAALPVPGAAPGAHRRWSWRVSERPREVAAVAPAALLPLQGHTGRPFHARSDLEGRRPVG
jgi:hypothetical protein